MSNKVMAVCRRYDPHMSVVGCDEGYLKYVYRCDSACLPYSILRDSITSYCAEHGMTPEECVQEMRAKIHEETALTASAGIAPNKVIRSLSRIFLLCLQISRRCLQR